jgi:magnesium chelatase family protein
MASEELGESSEVVRERVTLAREVAALRFAGEAWNLNSQIPPGHLRKRYCARKSAMNFLHMELDKERLSARGFHKVLRVAWSLADSRGHTIPDESDVITAYQYREGMELFH